MFLIHCPICNEPRSEDEFHCAGEGHIQRPLDPMATSDKEWGDYLFFRSNPRGTYRELWQHTIGCRKYFYIKRNTETYQIYKTYKLDDKSERVALDKEHSNKNKFGDLL
ncbi:MAG: sarcosine oxidase subunit delta [Enterobacterales bacterium]|nr:sarcosine oxidase subunit delta [Enterobacterales bacterium]